MKAKALKKEVIHTLQTVAKWIGDKILTKDNIYSDGLRVKIREYLDEL